ncbi:MAG: hypothetical protein ACJ75J_05875 [Cytophagaceae bacterium]
MNSTINSILIGRAIILHNLLSGGAKSIRVVILCLVTLLPTENKGQTTMPYISQDDFKVNTYTKGFQSDPAIAMDSTGNFVVTWSGGSADMGQDGDKMGIFAQRYNALGEPIGKEFMVNTFYLENQTDPAIAMNDDGDFVICWDSWHQDGSGSGIYAQRFNAKGEPQGAEFKVNTRTKDDQTNPAIAMNNTGDFAITWQSEGEDGDRQGIVAQKFDSKGNWVGPNFIVNSYTKTDQKNPQIAMDSIGNFVIVWDSYYQEGVFGDGIYGQRYDMAGRALGNEFHINSYIKNNQKYPSLGMNSKGDFVVVWLSEGQEPGKFGIYAQAYSSDGITNGKEFMVSSFKYESSAYPKVLLNTNGSFIITWYYSKNNSSIQVNARLFKSAGIALGNEFTVTTYTRDSQYNQEIAGNSKGDFTIVWQSQNLDNVFQKNDTVSRDGSESGIYAKRFQLK